MKQFNLYRISAFFILVVVTVLMMWVGKQHLVILENKGYEKDGQVLEAFDTVIVKVSQKEELEIYEGDSDYIEPVGPFLNLELEVFPTDGSPSRVIKKKLYLGFTSRVVLSVPQLVAEQEK